MGPSPRIEHDGKQQRDQRQADAQTEIRGDDEASESLTVLTVDVISTSGRTQQLRRTAPSFSVQNDDKLYTSKWPMPADQ
jgi:hypothetical protein